ncbi:hypothetical protein J3S85_21905 [Streptomyces lavenduligriseus]|nr:hypothetical protein J3S85_21905 [Streptomyces lavenduligriseus]
MDGATGGASAVRLRLTAPSPGRRSALPAPGPTPAPASGNLDGAPQYTPDCGRFFHQNGDYSKCPGGATRITEFDKWMLRGLWRHLKNRYGY